MLFAFFSIPKKCNYSDDNKYKEYAEYGIHYRSIHKKLRFCNHVYNNQMSVSPSQPIFPNLALREEQLMHGDIESTYSVISRRVRNINY